ncbi:protein Wnt-8a isoform X1 [Cricetulus griseus]|uniref:Protein Wnt n=1 Tax=Cricetulus griseus TaxID=10029 RepID=G3HF01_CRIGR|nr:protein Wnt-8a isoform X1 [Cricetulus griseus]EGW06698.1 Protein Wnt-8a [Cricetulus griseus]
MSSPFTSVFLFGRSVNNFLVTGPKAYLTYTTSVALGTQTGMEECKFQFAWGGWNCPEHAFQFSTHNRVGGATRESSFIHAIRSAGVVYIITKNCSMGDFENCGCDGSKNGKAGGHGWIWGGCSDNIEFGEQISRVFVDSLERGKDARALVNLHNSRAGRLVGTTVPHNLVDTEVILFGQWSLTVTQSCLTPRFHP